MSKDNPSLSGCAEKHPLAIAMWDFSWIERRWTGAGFEQWDVALDELRERGYNAVRIDAFPHLLSADPTKEWTLLPVWNQNCWGSPAVNRIVLQPAVEEFLGKCRERAIHVGLSCWYRQDIDDTRMTITSPEKMAENWIRTLDLVAKAGLMDTIFYVDLCNEWPGDLWTPYFQNDPPELTWTYWHTEKSMEYMRRAIAGVRAEFPDLPFCFSFTGGDPDLYAQLDLSFFDLLEHHTWLAQIHDGEFDKAVGYAYDRFTSESYDRLATNHEKIYLAGREHWQKSLLEEIERVGAAAMKAGLPLVTTECWGLVDFKDWPLLNWNIVKELCDIGTRAAAATSQWAAIATSNFCSPQFVGMWRDIDWHRQLTDVIKSSIINRSLVADSRSKLLARIQE